MIHVQHRVPEELSPEELARRCREVQATWDETTELSRRASDRDTPRKWRAPYGRRPIDGLRGDRASGACTRSGSRKGRFREREGENGCVGLQERRGGGGTMICTSGFEWQASILFLDRFQIATNALCHFDLFFVNLFSCRRFG